MAVLEPPLGTPPVAQPPPPRKPRRGDPRWRNRIVGAAAALVIVIVGVIVVVNVWPSSTNSGAEVSGLKAALDAVPLPAGTRLVDESAIAGHGDVQAIVEREYRLASSTDSSAQIHDALVGGGYRLVDPHSKQVDPAVWQSATTSTGGDVYVLPPDTTGDGIELRWQGDRLQISVQPGDVR